MELPAREWVASTAAPSKKATPLKCPDPRMPDEQQQGGVTGAIRECVLQGGAGGDDAKDTYPLRMIWQSAAPYLAVGAGGWSRHRDSRLSIAAAEAVVWARPREQSWPYARTNGMAPLRRTTKGLDMTDFAQHCWSPTPGTANYT